MTNSRTILIVTQEFDPHTDAIMRMLREAGHSPFRFHTADMPGKARFSVRIGAAARGMEGYLEAHDNRLDFNDISAVWWRRPEPFTVPDGLSRAERTFLRSELRSAWRGLLTQLDCYWMSHPEAIYRANYKVEQLARARALGLTIPDTLMTTRLDELRDFRRRHRDGVIFKAVADSMLPTETAGRAQLIVYEQDEPPPTLETLYGLFATPLTDEVVDRLEGLGESPCVFQERVAKDVELRVTVIGDEVFTAEIHSQSHERTREDWRHYEVDIPWRAGKLPEEVEIACLELTHGYGLTFGAIDLIRTPDGDHVFLEINPNGQWLFVEERVPELRMREALVACLLRGGTS